MKRQQWSYKYMNEYWNQCCDQLMFQYIRVSDLCTKNSRLIRRQCRAQCVLCARFVSRSVWSLGATRGLYCWICSRLHMHGRVGTSADAAFSVKPSEILTIDCITRAPTKGASHRFFEVTRSKLCIYIAARRPWWDFTQHKEEVEIYLQI